MRGEVSGTREAGVGGNQYDERCEVVGAGWDMLLVEVVVWVLTRV